MIQKNRPIHTNESLKKITTKIGSMTLLELDSKKNECVLIINKI